MLLLPVFWVFFNILEYPFLLEFETIICKQLMIIIVYVQEHSYILLFLCCEERNCKYTIKCWWMIEWHFSIIIPKINQMLCLSILSFSRTWRKEAMWNFPIIWSVQKLMILKFLKWVYKIFFLVFETMKQWNLLLLFPSQN